MLPKAKSDFSISAGSRIVGWVSRPVAGRVWTGLETRPTFHSTHLLRSHGEENSECLAGQAHPTQDGEISFSVRLIVVHWLVSCFRRVTMESMSK